MSLATIQHRVRTLHAQQRRDFVVTSLVRLLLIAYFVWSAATAPRVAMQFADGLVIVFVLATFYKAYRSVSRRSEKQEPAPGDAGATASLEFYRRELVRQRDGVTFVAWGSGWLLILTLLVSAVFIGVEWSARHPREVAAALEGLPPTVRRVGPIVAIAAAWVAAMVGYRLLGRRRRRALQRELDALETLRKTAT